jgi:hypothetical protein
VILPLISIVSCPSLFFEKECPTSRLVTTGADGMGAFAAQRGRSARRIVVGTAIGVAVVYVVALAALYANQRSLLFIRGREEWTSPPAGFSARMIARATVRV